MPRRIATLLLLLAAALGAQQRTEILWDTYGVPHIYARNAQELFHAIGWAEAQSHGDLLLRLFAQSRGRGAEFYGKQYIEDDRWIRINGIPEIAARWYREQKPEFRKDLDEFARGFNDYLRTNAGRIAAPGKPVLPVTPEDVLAHNLRVLHFTFVISPSRVEAYKRNWKPDAAAAPAGSNAWAISPGRAANGHAMLLANPHLPWGDYFQWFEMQIVAPGMNVYGASLVGFPIPAIAFNDYLGWTHTVNTQDGADLYELTLDGNGYRWNGGVHPFETARQTIKIRQPDGSLQSETLVVKRSVHGPVVAEKDGRALALRVVGLDQPHLLEQYWDMARAHNLREFESALSRLQMPMFTVVYADRDGHIMHLFGGRTPVRPRGDWSYWSGIVPGGTSETLWTRTHAYADLPRVLDPPGGWLQNANDPPWTTTFPVVLDPAKFPPYMAPHSMSFRAQRSARMLDEDRSITYQEMIRYKYSTRMELADRMLEDLIAAVRRSGRPAAVKAAQVLETWDRCADASSRGAVLFEAFAHEWMGHGNPWAVKWSESDPRTTPKGLDDPASAVAALEKAADQVERDWGSIDVAWGEVYRLRRAGLDLPANGGPGEVGIFRVINFRKDKDGKFAAFGGDSYVAAIEFTNPVRAMAVLGYGNSSQPGSPHQADQLEFLTKKQLRPTWRTRQEIEAHLESKTAL